MKRYPTPDMQFREDRGGVWYFRYYHPIIKDGKRSYVRANLSTGIGGHGKTPPREAIRKAEEMIKEAIDNKKVPGVEPAQVEVSKGVTLESRVKAFMDFHYGPHSLKSQSQIISVSRYLRYMVKYSPVKERDALTPEMAGKIYQDYASTPTRLGTPPNGRGRSHFLTNVCSYWDWEVAVSQGVVKVNPFAWIEKPGEDEFDETAVKWTQREYEDIYEALEHPEEKEALRWCRYAAMYPKDVYMIHPQHVKPKQGWAIVKGREKEEKKKRRKKQIIKLQVEKACPMLLDSLKERYAKALPLKRRLFCTHYNNPVLFTEQLGKRVTAAWEKVYPGHPHKKVKDLRHTRISEWRQMGIDPEIIGFWSGHVKGSKMVLKIYSHLEEFDDLTLT